MNYQLLAERAFLKHYITNLYPSGVCSYVSDTYDYWGVLTEVAPALKEDILSRVPDELGMAKVVFRPDSGDPVEILCGLEYVEIGKDVDSIQEAGRCECTVVKLMVSTITWKIVGVGISTTTFQTTN